MADNDEGEESIVRGKMADNEEGEESTARGNEWEVVQLTASTYAAAPCPGGIELSNEEKSGIYGEHAETSRALFMSGHFAFPTSQHENLPLKSDRSEHVDKDVLAEIGVEEEGRSSGKEEETLTLKGLNAPDEFAGKQSVTDKDNMQLIGDTEFEEGLTSADKDQTIMDAAIYHFDGETDLSSLADYGESPAVPGLNEPSEQGLGFSEDTPQSPRSLKDDEFGVSRLPCGAWWKRRAASLYSHAKEANAVWSIFVAAAVMGLVLLGQRWQNERWLALQQKWLLSVNDQKTGRMIGPISRLKDVIVSSHRRGSFIRSSSSSEV
ncbi:hypothetical protein ACFX13_041470 [Malus domestica]|nr:ATG8-interacting protein 1-like [Malus domestica]XP_008338833.1 ATG8-interacting protein 1-like [Malus domestica]